MSKMTLNVAGTKICEINLSNSTRTISSVSVENGMDKIMGRLWKRYKEKSYSDLENLFRFYFNEMESKRTLSDYIEIISIKGFNSVYQPSLSVLVE
ncbi:hypothetical protein [Enterococcus sp. AZ180]|uniref:hypothetical protein n=1 Tax=Enterococcus sp. AZ180 TaxID=2774961 RepID=UPI003F686B39